MPQISRFVYECPFSIKHLMYFSLIFLNIKTSSFWNPFWLRHLSKINFWNNRAPNSTLSIFHAALLGQTHPLWSPSFIFAPFRVFVKPLRTGLFQFGSADSRRDNNLEQVYPVSVLLLPAPESLNSFFKNAIYCKKLKKCMRPWIRKL